MTRSLPPHSSLSADTIFFLNSKLSSEQDLDGASNLVSEIQIECENLDQTLSDLNTRIQSHLTRHSSQSGLVGSLFSIINAQLQGLQQSSTHSPSDGESRRGVGVELQALAKEVARVETVRKYAETALKLDTLVGDIEDAVSSTLRRHALKKNSEDTREKAIRTLKITEDILSSVTKAHPQWAQLIAAVDHRVDRALAILRPQAIADHRTLLVSLGWPPSFLAPPPSSTLNSSNPDENPGENRSNDVQNPLFTMEGDLKQQYCVSFLALCGLQELQRQRKKRQLEGHYSEVTQHQSLWAIEELVNPLFIEAQRHFPKWIDKPELIFTLVYKMTRDYVDSMDELLQPLLDEAMLSGYSCREEWIASIVSSLSTYLAKEIFPTLVSRLAEESISGSESQARISFLHLIDLMIAFDKRIRSLAVHSGMSLFLEEDGNLLKISSLSLFCDRPDWLDLWAEIELSDMLDKLKHDMADEINWSSKGQVPSILSTQEDHKSPMISSSCLRYLSLVVDRCRSLPSISLSSRFIRLTGAPIIMKFLDGLLQRCQEAEGLTALADDSALTKVAKSVNAARYFEASLIEWCEDVFFLEMGLDHYGRLETPADNGTSIFDEEVRKLEQFRTEWVEKLSTVVLRGFDARFRDYTKNKKQWQEKEEEGWAVSRSFIGALDYLQGKMAVLEEGLNITDFTVVWRCLATGIDRLIFNGVLMSNVKFYNWGVERLGNDLRVLFGVFGAWCLRPEGFFPKASEGLQLLRLAKTQLKRSLVGDERWLKENGIRHLTPSQVEHIAKNRIYST